MFIQLELWQERPGADGQLPRFGARQSARLDTHLRNMTYLPINLASIVSFEPVQILTLNRPGTPDNKSDGLDGVRLWLANGAQYVVIDDKDPSFEQALAAARAADDVVYPHGYSAYLQRFASDIVR